MNQLVPGDLSIAYRPDLHLLTARWLGDAVPLPALQAQYAAIVEAARTHATSRLLLDVRRRQTPDQEAADWVTHQWLPLAASSAPGPLRLAFLISPTRQQALNTRPELNKVAREALNSTQPYRLEMFGDEGEAVRWLLA